MQSNVPLVLEGCRPEREVLPRSRHQNLKRKKIIGGGPQQREERTAVL